MRLMAVEGLELRFDRRRAEAVDRAPEQFVVGLFHDLPHPGVAALRYRAVAEGQRGETPVAGLVGHKRLDAKVGRADQRRILLSVGAGRCAQNPPVDPLTGNDALEHGYELRIDLLGVVNEYDQVPIDIATAPVDEVRQEHRRGSLISSCARISIMSSGLSARASRPSCSSDPSNFTDRRRSAKNWRAITSMSDC